MELKICPESLEVANKYLETSSIKETARELCIAEEKVSAMINKAEVKRYIDNVYLDTGYRNRFKLGSLLDEIIEAKLEEARDSEMFSSKDLVDIIALAHKMRMEEIKALNTGDTIRQQTNVQINETPFGSGKYGELMAKLVGSSDSQ